MPKNYKNKKNYINTKVVLLKATNRTNSKYVHMYLKNENLHIKNNYVLSYSYYHLGSVDKSRKSRTRRDF